MHGLRDLSEEESILIILSLCYLFVVIIENIGWFIFTIDLIVKYNVPSSIASLFVILFGMATCVVGELIQKAIYYFYDSFEIEMRNVLSRIVRIVTLGTIIINIITFLSASDAIQMIPYS